MDMGIVNSHEMLAIDDLERHLLKASTDLVFNSTSDATEKMLECTSYEKDCIEAKKANKPKPRIPRSWIERKDRKTFFEWENQKPVPATEPPLPVGEAARNHTPNSYQNSAIVHPKIAAVRERAAKANALAEAAKHFGDATIDYAQDSSLYPSSFPHFVRGRRFRSRVRYQVVYAAHRLLRWRHGNDDPKAFASGGGFPRLALQGFRCAREGQQRHAVHHKARCDLEDLR
eukprot:TRINITY_DN12116_c0_g1_i2.p1 TRINITY_DN12116_c0_g1~~TRINITY_DN12116_c0_g1_i2.p1  ORF type:complete len:247 (+),score=32.47 TRINITY_DN12116_c0_g1_i2:52-741(+)